MHLTSSYLESSASIIRLRCRYRTAIPRRLISSFHLIQGMMAFMMRALIFLSCGMEISLMFLLLNIFRRKRYSLSEQHTGRIPEQHTGSLCGWSAARLRTFRPDTDQ